MRSKARAAGQPHSPLPLTLAAVAALLFLNLPFVVILMYAFTTDEQTFSFPLPGLTLRWFGEAVGRVDLWNALSLSLQVALGATALALLGEINYFDRTRDNLFADVRQPWLRILLALQLPSGGFARYPGADAELCLAASPAAIDRKAPCVQSACAYVRDGRSAGSRLGV